MCSSDLPWLYHAHIAAAMNLKLLHPREVVAAAEAAYRAGQAPLASVEGFIRQILGWREYVRGIYWTRMPAYAEANALGAQEPLPAWYWTGATDMACLRDTIEQTLKHGYAHHIQRLMVTGLFALMYGVQPQQVHAWYLAVYVDAVEWVELPNTLGMAMHADGGLMASKPYVATGKYIQRMSSGSYCRRCPYDPAERLGDRTERNALLCRGVDAKAGRCGLEREPIEARCVERVDRGPARRALPHVAGEAVPARGGDEEGEQQRRHGGRRCRCRRGGHRCGSRHGSRRGHRRRHLRPHPPKVSSTRMSQNVQRGKRE